MNLKKRIQQLEKENKSLKEENRYLKMALEAIEKRLLELEELAKEKSKPSFVKEDVRSYHHKTGQKEGHEGISREIPEKIDEVKKWDM